MNGPDAIRFLDMVRYIETQHFDTAHHLIPTEGLEYETTSEWELFLENAINVIGGSGRGYIKVKAPKAFPDVTLTMYCITEYSSTMHFWRGEDSKYLYLGNDGLMVRVEKPPLEPDEPLMWSPAMIIAVANMCKDIIDDWAEMIPGHVFCAIKHHFYTQGMWLFEQAWPQPIRLATSISSKG